MTATEPQQAESGIPPTESLAQAHEIRDGVVVLGREENSRSPHAGEDLVGDEQCAAGPGPPAPVQQESPRGNADTRTALYGLDDDGAERRR